MFNLILFVSLGLIFLLIEMFLPTMFFLNFAVASFVCAILTFFTDNLLLLIGIGCVLSVALLFTLRPLVLKFNKNLPDGKTGIQDKYIGKTAAATSDINKDSGTISIYDERWQARNIEDSVIPNGSKVEITGHESIVLYVKKID